MSAPPEYRGRRRIAGSTGQGGIAWPISSDTGPRAPRPDLLAAVITVLAGAAGIGQLFLSWSSTVPGVNLPDVNGGLTGWSLYRSARAVAALSTGNTITAYSVVGTALAGAVLVLLGSAMLLPIDHRPLGAVSIIIAVLVLAGTSWWLIRGHHALTQSLGDLFAHAGPGWYLFIASGPVGIAGSTKALATG